MAGREFQVVQVTEALILDVAARMRPEDVEEIRACWGMTPEECLRYSLRNSDETAVLMLGGEAAGICGHSGELGGAGVAWWLTTETVERHKKSYMRACRHAASALRARYAEVSAYTDVRYTRAIRWLEALGFEVVPERVMGPAGSLLCRTVMKGEG